MTSLDWTVAKTALMVVATVVVLMVALPKIHRAIPESLTAVVVATVLVVSVGIPAARIGELPAHLPAPYFRTPT